MAICTDSSSLTYGLDLCGGDSGEGANEGNDDYQPYSDNEGNHPYGSYDDLMNYWADSNAQTPGFALDSSQYPSSSSYGASGSKQAIDWADPLGATLLPLIQKTAGALPGLAAGMENTIQGQYDSLMRQAMAPPNFQGLLNQLANQGVLNSSIAGDAMGTMGAQIAQDIANQAYASHLQGISAQMQVPGMLGQLAELARVAEAQSVSQSQYSDPLAPYTLMAQLLMAQ